MIDRALARTLRAAAAGGVLAAALAVGATAAPCTPWPGEPTPLPSRADPDALRARWAELRAQELSLAAAALEAADPVEAQRLWRRVLCLDRSNDAALAGIVRTPLVQVHRPPVVAARPGEARDGDPWALDRPVPVALAVVPPEPPPAPRLAAVEGLIAEAEARLRGARFEDALVTADQARLRLRRVQPLPDRRSGQARVEVLAATAELALGRDADARASLGRALDANPALELDPMTTSPKVRRALEAVRQARGSG